MTLSMRFLIALVLAAGFVACDSMELTIAVNKPADGWLEVVNANDRVWKDARLVVEAFESEGTTRPCGEESVSRWEPGQDIGAGFDIGGMDIHHSIGIFGQSES